jgi:hypothetical protein
MTNLPNSNDNRTIKHCIFRPLVRGGAQHCTGLQRPCRNYGVETTMLTQLPKGASAHRHSRRAATSTYPKNGGIILELSITSYIKQEDKISLAWACSMVDHVSSFW